MRQKLAAYTLLYFFSFCFFSIFFHTAVTAQTNENNVLIDPAQKILSTNSMPTPTIYIAPTSIPTPISTTTPTPPPPTSTPIPTEAIIVTDLESLFAKYADEYHTDRELLKKIAGCESGFNSQSDSGLYAGMFQFASQTWISNRNTMGLDPNPDLRKNAEESIRTAAFMISRGQQDAWPSCSR